MPHYWNPKGPQLQLRIDAHPPDVKTLGGRIRHCRYRLKLSQVDFCKLIKQRNVRAYSRWESGEHRPSLEWLVKIAQAADTTTDYLLTGKP